MRNMLRAYQDMATEVDVIEAPMDAPSPARDAAYQAHMDRIRAVEGIEWKVPPSEWVPPKTREPMRRVVAAYLETHSDATWEDIHRDVPNKYKHPNSMRLSLAYGDGWKCLRGIRLHNRTSKQGKGREGRAAQQRAAKAAVAVKARAYRKQHPGASWRETFENVPNHYSNFRSMHRALAEEIR